MKQVEETYISLLTDFGFKRIFGTAMNKDLLICFLISKTLLIRRSKKVRMRKPWKIAKNMLADGVDINLIKKYSGLTQEQIEKMK